MGISRCRGAETLPISMGAFISAILAFMMGGRGWEAPEKIHILLWVEIVDLRKISNLHGNIDVLLWMYYLK